jgi:hypothetical protein
MSYSARANDFPFVQPSGLLRFSDSSSMNTTMTAGDKILMADTEDLIGSGVASIASGVITLPAGYYYLLQGSFSVGDQSGTYYPQSRQIYTRFYDEGGAAYIGTESYQNTNLPSSGTSEIGVLLSRDETARVWVDATGAAKSVSWRISSTTYPWDASDILYPISGLTPRLWVGWTRCMIWRFE